MIYVYIDLYIAMQRHIYDEIETTKRAMKKACAVEHIIRTIIIIMDHVVLISGAYSNSSSIVHFIRERFGPFSFSLCSNQARRAMFFFKYVLKISIVPMLMIIII